ncbi:hypothetical protein [Geminicoccus roseus]|uniref:hypothetical protein n=1 Tax=Geminicoccus roseus TaxID=404900 RepID=UPI0003FEFD2A|nr:hypothetical protein [Geminicoccus roseus]
MSARLGPAGLVVAPVAAALAALLLLSVLQDLLLYATHGGVLTPEQWQAGTRWLLEVNSERSFYTWVSSSLIFLNAVLLFVIALRAPGRFWSWGLLSFGFVLLSMDEAMAFHERLGSLLGQYVETGGIFHFAWVIPGLLICIAAGLAFIPLLRSLPRPTMLLFVLSGAAYVGGALGMEMLGSRHAEQHGTYTMTYQMMANLEEGLEGLGMLLFLYALVRHALAQRILALPEPAAATVRQPASSPPASSPSGDARPARPAPVRAAAA